MAYLEPLLFPDMYFTPRKYSSLTMTRNAVRSTVRPQEHESD